MTQEINNKNNIINIATSCSDSIANYIMPQMASIKTNLANYHINFFLLHSNINEAKIYLIEFYARQCKNISFYEIKVENTEVFDYFARFGGKWPKEAYFWLQLHLYLPLTLERVLYIDAGDIIIENDIKEYYFGDFKGKSIIATAEQFYIENDEVLYLDSREHITNLHYKDMILKRGSINTGCIVINLKKLRDNCFSLYSFKKVIKEIDFYDNDQMYFGDQGLGSYIFAGDILFFFQEKEKKEWYMPYNFGLWFFNENNILWYTPMIIHYTGIHYKPWEARFVEKEIAENMHKVNGEIQIPFHKRIEQMKYYELWWKYCNLTPIYNDINRQAHKAAVIMIKMYEKKYDVNWKHF